MQGFDIEQLRTLVTAVDAGSLSAAVPLRCLSQSALSEQLRKLEERAGQALLLRSKAGVRPTAAGERLLVHARQILAMADAAWRDLHSVPLDGELHLGITDYFHPASLTRLLARLAEQYPRLRLRTRVGRSNDLEAAQRSGAIDLAVIMRFEPAPEHVGAAHWLLSEPLVWATAPGRQRIAEGRPVELALLPEGCALHRLACQQLDAQRIPYVVTHVASGVAGLQAGIAAGLGVGCINASALMEGSVVKLANSTLPPLPQAHFELLAARREDGRFGQSWESLVQVLVGALAAT
jgi:DNA-binding transcriptional LysR family regulator